jgi:tetratricopeptide (TPR) repeat protein
LWVDASSSETIKQSLLDGAEQLISKEIAIDKSADSVLHWLSSCENEWLLIFDNADEDPGIVSKATPQGNRGNILITSRNPDARRLVDHKCWIQLEEMEESDAVDLLLRSAFLDESSIELRSTATTLVKELCCHALAVDQAGAVIASGFCSIHYYLQVYRTRAKELLEFPIFKAASNYDKAVFGTWDVSFNAIERKAQGSDAREAAAATTAILLLRIFSMFHHENIMREIFAHCSSSEPWPTYPEDTEGELSSTAQYLPSSLLGLDDRGNWDPFNFSEGIRILSSVSFIKSNATGSAYSVHPLVHFWTSEKMVLSMQQEYCWIATSILCGAVQPEKRTMENTAFRARLLPHIISYRKHALKAGIQNLSHDDEMDKYEFVYYENGYWQQSLELATQAVAIRKRVLGNHHKSTLDATYLACWGSWMLDMGEKAEQIAAEALASNVRLITVDPEIAMNFIYVLGRTYLQQNRLDQADALIGQVVEAETKLSDSKSLAYFQAKVLLADIYAAQGKLELAQKVAADTVHTAETTFGEEHGRTLDSMEETLAYILCEMKRFGEAEKLCRRILEIQRKNLGQDHSTTIHSMSLLAYILLESGKSKEAEELYLKVISNRERREGLTYNTLASMYNFALTVKRQGRYDEAIELMRNVEVAARQCTSEIVSVEYVRDAKASLERWPKERDRFERRQKTRDSNG